MRQSSYTVLTLVLVLAAPSLARPDGVGGHHGEHHADHAAAPAPSSGYQQPSSGYEQPSAGYEQPSSGYEQPSSGYEQPSAAGYEQPSYGYEEPSGYEQGAYDGYEESIPGGGYGDNAAGAAGGFDLSVLLVPILIIAGLALLFPQVITVPVNRRRREAGDTSSNLVERVQDIYMSVVQSEECMERVACEVGGIAADAGLNKGMTKMAESFVPKKYQKMMKNFNSAKDCHKIKCGVF